MADRSRFIAGLFLTTVFWGVMSCTLVDRQTMNFWRNMSTELHGAMFQTTVILTFTAVSTVSLTRVEDLSAGI